MQINSSWLPKLRKYGIGVNELFDPCTSIQVGAWILAQNIQRLGHSWEAVGAYNSSIPADRQNTQKKCIKICPFSSDENTKFKLP